MGKFYFHTQDGHIVLDEDGTELPDLASARVEAVRLAGGHLADRPQELWEAQRWRLMVADDAGKAIFVIEVNTAQGADIIPWGRH